MRKLSLFLLLATSAMPALAQRGDSDGARQGRSEQAQSRAERPQRAERFQRSERAERPERAERAQVVVERNGAGSERMQQYRQQMEERRQQNDPARAARLQEWQQRRQQSGEQQVQNSVSREQRIQQWRERRGDSGPQGGGLVQRDRPVRTIPVLQPEAGQVGPVRTDVVRRIGRDGRYEREGRPDVRDGRNYRHDRDRWVRDWRHDRRYDWRRYRDRNRSIFSLGFYFDPFGYNYRRFGIGSYLYPSYYQSNYWIHDPWQYRLPPAYGPYRWVRYHSDAVLIDTWTGEVVDVIYGFFW